MAQTDVGTGGSRGVLGGNLNLKKNHDQYFSFVVSFEQNWTVILNRERRTVLCWILFPVICDGVVPCSFLVGPREPLLATVKRRNLAWFGHVTRHDSLSEIILQGTLEGGRRRGRERKCWMDNIIEWTSLPMSELLTRVSCKKDWEMIYAESSLMSPRRPNRSRIWTELCRASTDSVTIK